MKKILFLFSLICICTTSASIAQNIGVRAGFSLATLTGSDAEAAAIAQYTQAVSNIDIDNIANRFGVDAGALRGLNQVDPKPLPSFFAGAYLNLEILDRFQLEPGVYIASRGYQIDRTIAGIVNLEVTNRSYYLEVPILARVFLTDNLNIYGGPQFALLLSNDFNTDLSALVFQFDFDSEADEALNKVDFGLTLGLGYALPLGFNVQAGYDLGLVRYSEDIQAYNGVWKLGAGFTF